MTDDSNTPPERSEFDALVAYLRRLVKQENAVQKAEQRRIAVNAVMKHVAEGFAAGRLSTLDVSRLHALRLRLDCGLLPEERG